MDLIDLWKDELKIHPIDGRMKALSRAVDRVLDGFEDDNDALFYAEMEEKEKRGFAKYDVYGLPVSALAIREALAIRNLVNGDSTMLHPGTPEVICEWAFKWRDWEKLCKEQEGQSGNESS